MKKIQISLLAILLIFCQFVLAAPKEEALDRVIAIINQDVITESQLQNEIADLQTMQAMQQQAAGISTAAPSSAESLRKDALQRLINRNLQMQYAKRAKIEVSEEMIDATIRNVASQNNMTLEEFNQALDSQGMTINQYRKKIRTQLLEREVKQKVIAPQVKVSDAEVAQGLQNPENPMNSRKRYLVHDYLVETDENAKKSALAAAAKTAKSVQDLVIKGHRPSEDKADFIDLGWRYQHELPSAFAGAVRTMTKGETHAPIRAANGYHVLKLADVQAPHQNSQVHEYKLRHILMKPTALLTDNLVKKQLEKIKQEVAAGTTFTKLARKYSEDYETAGSGGDMGWLKQREMPQSFMKAVESLRKGQISAPFQSEAGWHLLYVEDVREKDDSKAMAKQETKAWLFQQKVVEASDKWLADLRERTFIQYPAAPVA